MLQTAFRPSWINQTSVFERHKRFKEGRESVRDDERCGRSKEVNTPELIDQRIKVEVLREFMKRFCRKRPALFKSGQWHFHQDNTPVHNSILVTDYLTKMAIKTVPHCPYSPDLAPCDFGYSLSSEAVVMKHLRRWKRLWRRSLTRSHKWDFHGAFQKLLERYNNCIAAGGDYFKVDWSFICVLSIKVAHYEKSL